MEKIILFFFCFVIAGCCSSGTKRDWFSHEVEILPIKSFENEFGYEGPDFLSEKFQIIKNGKKELVDIANFNEFKWGTSFKAILRGYTDVSCGMQDAPTHLHYFKVEKIISKLPVSEQTCFEENIPTSGRSDPLSLYAKWEESFSKLDSQITKEDSQIIRTNIGKSKIDYRICILNSEKSKIKIDNVKIRP